MEEYQVSESRELLAIEKAEAIAKVIRDNASTLKRIILKNKSYSKEAAKIIGAAMAKVVSLEEVDLSDTISGLSEKDAQASLECFADCLKEKELRYLDLSDNALGPQGILCCEPLICGKRKLEVLLLNNDGLSGDSIYNLQVILQKMAPLNIKRIEFFNNMCGEKGARAIPAILECLPHLEVFRWASCRTTGESALVLCEGLRHCPCLRRLELKDNYFGEECEELLSSNISKMKDLKELVLSDISINDDTVISILSSIGENSISLTILDLSLNDITEEAIMKLCDILPSQKDLEVLDIHGNYIGSRGICMLANKLEKQCPSLMEFNVEGNQVGPKAAEKVVKMCYILYLAYSWIELP